jgi:hypothetical protein
MGDGVGFAISTNPMAERSHSGSAEGRVDTCKLSLAGAHLGFTQG